MIVGTIRGDTQRPGLGHRLHRRSHSVLHELVLLAQEGLVHAVLFAVEVPDHTGYPDGKSVGREVGDGGYSADAADEGIPEGPDVVAHGRDDAHAGYDYSVLHIVIWL